MDITYLTTIESPGLNLYIYLGDSEDSARAARAKLVEPSLAYQVATVENVEKVQQIAFNWIQDNLEVLSGKNAEEKVGYDKLQKVVEMGVRAESFFGMTSEAFGELLKELFGEETFEKLSDSIPDFPPPPKPPVTVIDPDIVKTYRVSLNADGAIAQQDEISAST